MQDACLSLETKLQQCQPRVYHLKQEVKCNNTNRVCHFKREVNRSNANRVFVTWNKKWTATMRTACLSLETRSELQQCGPRLCHFKQEVNCKNANRVFVTWNKKWTATMRTACLSLETRSELQQCGPRLCHLKQEVIRNKAQGVLLKKLRNLGIFRIKLQITHRQERKLLPVS